MVVYRQRRLRLRDFAVRGDGQALVLPRGRKPVVAPASFAPGVTADFAAPEFRMSPCRAKGYLNTTPKTGLMFFADLGTVADFLSLITLTPSRVLVFPPGDS